MLDQAIGKEDKILYLEIGVHTHTQGGVTKKTKEHTQKNPRYIFINLSATQYPLPRALLYFW